MLLVLFERRLSHQWTRSGWRVHGLLALSRCQHVGFAGLAELRARGEPRCRTRAQFVGVKTGCGACASGALTTVAKEYRDGIVGMTRLNPDSTLNFFALQFDFNYIFRLQTKALG